MTVSPPQALPTYIVDINPSPKIIEDEDASVTHSVTDADGLHEQLYKSTKDIVKIHAKGSDVGTTMYGNTNRSQSVSHRLVCGPTALPGQ